MTSLGSRFAAAISDRDRSGLRGLLGESLDFKALTPGRFWEAESPADVDGIVFDHWFEEDDRISYPRIVCSGYRAR